MIHRQRVNGFFKPNIDFLRAIAVLSVACFHFNLFGVSGGFIGVDVFFVISGYLMTKIILDLQERDSFSIFVFAKKRITRLFPAYLTVIALSTIVAWVIYNPSQFRYFSLASTNSISGTSNIFYWLESGYFDAKAIEKPLLHTWSLSLEFQFYLLWSILLIIIKKSQQNIRIIIYTVSIISFALSCITINYAQSAAFFLLPSRLWEFSIGGLVYLSSNVKIRGQILQELSFLSGMLLILYPIFFYNSDTLFPAYYALPPTIGTAIVLFVGGDSRVCGALCGKVVLFIGKISYSLYLVHWPFFVFLRQFYPTHIPHSYRFLMLLFVIIISIFLHYAIEEPLRRGRAVFGISPLRLISVFTIALSSYIFFTWLTGGIYVHRSPEDYITRQASLYDVDGAKAYEFVNHIRLGKADDFSSAKKHLLIIGDSQSADIVNILVKTNVEEKFEIITRKILNECGTIYIEPEQQNNRFLVNEKIRKKPEMRAICSDLMERLVRTSAIKNADIVIIAFQWSNNDLTEIDNVIRKLLLYTNAKIYLVGKKEFNHSSVEILIQNGQSTHIGKMAWLDRNTDALQFNERLKTSYPSMFIDAYSFICNFRYASCQVYTENFRPTMFDGIHFTPEAAEEISKNRIKSVMPFLFQY
jgi:peptidoglycan/LPS O-acetylase OafA/YrhL